jgi:hypothetical protein
MMAMLVLLSCFSSISNLQQYYEETRIHADADMLIILLILHSNVDSADDDLLTIMLKRMMDSVTIVVKNESDANHVLATRIIHIK